MDGDIALFPPFVLLGCGGFAMSFLLRNVGLGCCGPRRSWDEFSEHVPLGYPELC